VNSDRQRVEDCCAASAAELFNLLPDLMALSEKERYQRLVLYLATTVLAVRDALRGWYSALAPSDN
jgi:hypothetical protein